MFLFKGLIWVFLHPVETAACNSLLTTDIVIRFDKCHCNIYSMKGKQLAMYHVSISRISSIQVETLNELLFQQSKTDTDSYMFSITIMSSSREHCVCGAWEI